MGMQTTFTACSRLACLHIDRFALDHQGRPSKQEWDLEVNPTVWLPIQAEEELGFTHKPYTVVAAVAHRGNDAEGHLQAVGLSAQGWMLFNDLQEAQVMGPTPPRTSEWVFVWLARDDSVELGLNRFGLTGTDLFPRALATLYEQHQMKLENYPEEVLARLRSFCSVCGKLVVSHDALKKHVRLRHSELGQVIRVDQFMQEHRDCANLPCHGCGACHILSRKPLQMFHFCHVELNVQLGVEHNNVYQVQRSEQFEAGRTVTEELQALDSFTMR